MRTRVFIRTSFEGFHRWLEAPDEVAFLRDRHRHLFHVRAEVRVSHGAREIEFILLKRELGRVIAQAQLAESDETQNVEEWSCEMWATYLMNRLGLDRCEVSEDGENGAIVEL